MEKIAVASTDGKEIDEHFGSAQQFYIFLIGDDDSITADGVRKVVLPANLPESEFLEAKVKLLADVTYVLSAKIGPGAVAALSRNGTKGYAYTGKVGKALENYVKRRGLINNLTNSESTYLESCVSKRGCGGKGGGCGSGSGSDSGALGCG